MSDRNYQNPNPTGDPDVEKGMIDYYRQKAEKEEQEKENIRKYEAEQKAKKEQEEQRKKNEVVNGQEMVDRYRKDTYGKK